MTSSPEWPLAVTLIAVGGGLAFRLHAIVLPTETLTSRYLADDYFYYLNVAYHLAHGRGSSFDGGLTVTNGYQPLFLWLLAALFSLGLTKAAAIHAGLAIQAAAAAAASGLAYLVLAARGAAWGGAAIAILLSMNLFFVLPSLTGFEMALALAAILLAVWVWQRNHSPFIIGLCCGLAVLARIDSLALALTFVVYLTINGAANGPGMSRVRPAVIFLAGVVSVAGPWLLWNWIVFGSPMPDSGVMKAHYRGAAAAARASAATAYTLPRTLLPGRVVDWLNASAPWMVVISAAVILAGAVRGAMIKTHRPLAITALGLFIAYVVLIGDGEPGALVRYLYPVWAIVALLFLVEVNRSTRLATAVCGLVFAAHAADLAIYLRWEASAPLQATFVGAAHTVLPAAIAALPAHDRVAAFDSGAIGYFAPRPVINLDGLANHDIVTLRRTCVEPYSECLKLYFHSMGITMLAGGTAFGWTGYFTDWTGWERVYESPPLVDGSRLVILRLP